jgi:uncharacterized protein (DUF1778 family)
MTLAVATNKESIYAYVTGEEKELLKKLAKARDRSLSNLMGQLLKREIETALSTGEITN